MSRRGKPEDRRGTNGEQKVAFSFTSNSSALEVANWDVKPQLLTDAILCGLASGLGIMFGKSLDGGSLSVTIYDGDAKSRKWVSDVVDLEDVLQAIIAHAQRSGVGAPRAGLRAVGD